MRKSRLYILIALAILGVISVVIVLTGSSSDTNSMNTTLYFFNKDSSTIVPFQKEIVYLDRNDLFEKTVAELIKGPDNKKFSPIMEKNVKTNRISVKDKSLTIDFSEEFKTDNILGTYAIVKTMSQFPDIKSVKVSVSGKNVLPEGFLSGEEINLESDDDCLAGMNLYFADKKKSKLVREYRKINISDTKPVEQYIVYELIKGPKNENLSSLLSADTGVISVETTDGTCYVNFKQDFISKNLATSDVEKLTIYSIVNSLTEREHIKNVQFLIEGKKTDRFGDMEISNLFYRDETFIEDFDKINS